MTAIAEPSGMVSAPPEVINAAIQWWDTENICIDSPIDDMANRIRATMKCYSAAGKSLQDPVTNMKLEPCVILDITSTPMIITAHTVIKNNTDWKNRLDTFYKFLDPQEYEFRVAFFTNPHYFYYKKRVLEVKNGDIKTYLENSAKVLDAKMPEYCKSRHQSK